MFRIFDIVRVSQDSVCVKVLIPAKEWNDIKTKGDLGFLYGVDISNTAFKEFGVKAHNPSVNDSERAKGGVKVIELFYSDSEWKPVDNVIHVDFINRRKVA